MDIYLSVLIGAIIYGLIDFVSATGKDVISKKYLLTTIVNIIAGGGLVWMLKLHEAELIFNNFDFVRLIGAAFGVFGQKFFKALIKLADKNISTKIGLNKKK